MLLEVLLSLPCEESQAQKLCWALLIVHGSSSFSCVVFVVSLCVWREVMSVASFYRICICRYLCMKSFLRKGEASYCHSHESSASCGPRTPGHSAALAARMEFVSPI